MSLVRAERRRFLKRRLTRWLVPIGVVILGLVATAIFFSHEVHTEAALARGEIRAEQEYQQQLADHTRFKAQCERETPGQCDWEAPIRENYQAEHFLNPTFDFKGNYQGLLLVWAAIIAMIGFLLGATFVGAEWNSGAMMNLLTWRPKRMAVLGTKLGVLLGWMTAIGAVTLGLWTAALWTIGLFRGHTNGLTSGVWQSFGLSSLRGLGLILLFTALGFGLASIGRHTALALGAALGVIVVGQIGLTIVFEMARVKFYEQFLIPYHLDAWMNKETVLVDWRTGPDCSADGACEMPELVMTWQQSGSYGLAVAVVVLGVAFWQMRRRDVA